MRIARLLPKDGFGRSVALLAGSTGLAQALAVVCSPLITRLYEPSDFGLLAVYTSLLGIAAIISGGRYELTVPLFETDADAANALALSLGCVILCALLTAAVVAVLGEHLLPLLNAEGLLKYLWLLPIGVLGAGSYQSLSYWAIRGKSFKLLAQTRMTQSVSGVATQVAMGALHTGALGLMLGQVASQSAGVLKLWKHLSQEKDSLRAIRPDRMRRVAREYAQFPLLSAPSALLNSAGLLLPAALISALYGVHSAGLFALAQRIIGIPMSLIGSAISQVYLGETAVLARESPRECMRVFRMVTRKMLLLSLLLIAAGACAPLVFGPVFGRAWHDAGIYTAFLSIGAAGQLVVSPISNIAIVSKRQGVQALCDLLRIVVVLSAIYVPYRMDAPVVVAVGAYGVGMLAVYGVSYAAYLRIAQGYVSGREADRPADA